MHIKTTIKVIGSLCLINFITGCAVSSKDVRDPYESWNRGVQSFNDTVDKYALKPVAEGYNFVMPSFANVAVTNFFNNIDDIGVTINDFLQLKFEQSGQDGARFLVNTVAGVGGFIDVAQELSLTKHEEDFDQTLGFWGVPSGPYLVLPLLGPSTARGIGGRIGDAAMNPITYIGFINNDLISGINNGFITGGINAIKVIDLRSDNLVKGNVAAEAAVDRYDFFKNSYYQRRDFLLNDGKTADDIDVDNLEMDKNSSPKKSH